MTIREWLTANRESYTDRNKWIDDCVKKTRFARKSVENMASQIWPVGTNYQHRRAKPTATRRGVGLTKEQFRDTYDFDTKIRRAIQAGIEKLINSEEELIVKDSEFRMEFCGNVSVQGYRMIAEEETFRKYQFRTSKNDIHWTTPQLKRWALAEISSARDL